MTVIFAILISYCVLLVTFYSGWKKSLRKTFPAESLQSNPVMISVVIPVRNEEKNIRTLLDALSGQDYADFEIILVDDHSGDGSVSAAKDCNLKNLVILKNRNEGKKHAITMGVHAARGSIIVTTDADCTMEPQWLAAISRFFRDKQVKLAFGGVRFQESASFFSALQSLEFASLIGSGAATSALGFPIMCNGANLAYRKEIFMEVNGYQGNLDIPSGDDEFLMRKVQRQYPSSIRFMGDPAAVVSTGSSPDLSSFYQQRVRWASKWRFNSSSAAIALAVYILFVHTAVLFLCFHLVFFFSFWTAGLLLMKVFFEAFLLLQFCKFLRIPFRLVAFITLQFVYPIYVIVVATTANFVTYEWKGRKSAGHLL